MSIALKRERFTLLILLSIIFLSTTILAETGYFVWYDNEGNQCHYTSATISDGTVTYSGAAPTSVLACCDSQGTIKVRFYTDYDSNQYKQTDAYTIDWDNDQTDCACYSATNQWMPGKVFEASKPSCCGDDYTEEFFESFRVYSSNTAESKGKLGGDKASDNACCNNVYDCVYNSMCYTTNAYYDLDSDGRKDYFCYNSQDPSWWINVDYHKSYCDANNYKWNLRYGDARAEENYYTTTGTFAENYCTIGDAGHPSTQCCCGDDTGEEYVTQGIGSAPACCDKSTDCLDRNNRCQGEYGKEVTCRPWDGFDNDCDGLTDCSDTDCSSSTDCQVCKPEVCNNGKDDDCDHYIDCADSDCLPSCPTCSVEICSGETDEDCDTKTDCADNDCIWDPNCQTCNNGGPAVQENCDNKKDDDCDGLKDHQDWDCQGCPNGKTVCQDGSCSEDCDETGGGKQGCIGDSDGKCAEGEGCACEDCYGKRDSCAINLICDSNYETCICSGGLILCPDGGCKETCGICGNGELEQGEECDGAEFGGNTCPETCTGSLSCTAECKIDSTGCSCPGCEVTNGDTACCVIDGDGKCDSDCTANADPDCKDKPCTSEFGDCCKDSPSDGTCDPDCIPYKDPDCSTSCTQYKDDCCDAETGNGCDPDCNQDVDTDCGTCTNNEGDCCSDKKDNVCDTDCITGVDPDCKCGNLAIDTGEVCDRTNLQGKDCSKFFNNEKYKGVLACNLPRTTEECHYDTAGCYESSCVTEDGECEIGKGEDCRCVDCLGKQVICGYGQVCDETARCKCEDGTTLCGEGICKLALECSTLPACDGDRACETGEGCSCSDGAGCASSICSDCNGKSDTCRSSSTCINGICTACSIAKVYWSEDCVGDGIPNGASMIVEGTAGCKGKTVELHLKEQDVGVESALGEDDNIETISAVFDDKGKVEFKWTPKFFEKDEKSKENSVPNDCALLWCDAEKSSDNPPKKFLEFYFEAKRGNDIIKSDILNVHYCVYECDKDCDTYVDAGLESVCQEEINDEDLKYGTHKGEFRIDANPKSGYCEDCTPDGLSKGQETCAAYYDCTPGWWKETMPEGWTEQTKLDATSALEWGECGEDKGAARNQGLVTDKTRNRLVCPLSLTKEQCCAGQSSCYCDVPETGAGEEAEGLDCNNVDFRPTEIKACLAEEKFPFFTNMNILIVLLILVGFYIWKTRTVSGNITKKKRKARTKK